MSLSNVKHSRSIYSALDFLGDVGGLYSILLDISSILISLIYWFTGDAVSMFLRRNLFTVQGSDRENNDRFGHIKSRVKITYPFCHWTRIVSCFWRTKRTKFIRLMIEKGDNRIE